MKVFVWYWLRKKVIMWKDVLTQEPSDKLITCQYHCRLSYVICQGVFRKLKNHFLQIWETKCMFCHANYVQQLCASCVVIHNRTSTFEKNLRGLFYVECYVITCRDIILVLTLLHFHNLKMLSCRETDEPSLLIQLTWR